jgi:hypothetical protein
LWLRETLFSQNIIEGEEQSVEKNSTDIAPIGKYECVDYVFCRGDKKDSPQDIGDIIHKRNL